MKTGLNAIFLEGKRTGVGRYLESLLREWAYAGLSDEFVLYFLNERPCDSFLADGPFDIRRLSMVEYGQMDVFQYELTHSPVDVFFSALYDLPLSVNCPAVITVHDMIHEAFPESFSDIQLNYLREKHAFSIGRAARIITDSDFSKNEIISRFPEAEGRITVIPLAASPVFKERDRLQGFVRKRFGVSEPFIFYVGAVTPKRHIRPAIEAFQALAGKFPQWSLITIGRNVTYPYEDLHGLASQANSALGRHAVVYEEFIGDRELLELYNAADIFIYLSTYEGFGMPPLEAMACGTPVITTTVSSLPEVAGDAALLVNPADGRDVCNALDRLMESSELREEYRTRGLRRAEQFSWERTALRTMEVLREAACL
jgi:glycosyltransferase involved in cell wall biosynthesis